MSAATPEGNERLRTLYAVMGGVPDEKVDMTNWRGGLGTWLDHGLLDTDCGTNACAVGWACAYPEFKAQGLRYDGTPEFKKSDGTTFYYWTAVENFFGLSEAEAHRLFNNFDTGSNAKRGVMHRIRELLLERGVITAERSAELELEEKRL